MTWLEDEAVVLNPGVCHVPGDCAWELYPVGLHQPAAAQGAHHAQLWGRPPQALQVPLPRPQARRPLACAHSTVPDTLKLGRPSL